MKRDPKKIVAAAIGVIEYLKAENERARQESMEAPATPTPPRDEPITPFGSFWAASGRTEIMRLRNLMELRVFRRGR